MDDILSLSNFNRRTMRFSTYSQTINIGAVNDMPVNTVPGTQTVAEETTTAIAGVSISDVDAGAGNLTTRLQATSGVLNVTLSGSAALSAGANDTGDKKEDAHEGAPGELRVHDITSDRRKFEILSKRFARDHDARQG